jgi:hypothetical protein
MVTIYKFTQAGCNFVKRTNNNDKSMMTMTAATISLSNRYSKACDDGNTVC